MSAATALLATCSEEEKEGIRVAYVQQGDYVIPLLDRHPAIKLPDLPEMLAEEHCLSSDDDREVKDSFELQLSDDDERERERDNRDGSNT
jgi:hypothetical protein